MYAIIIQLYYYNKKNNIIYFIEKYIFRHIFCVTKYVYVRIR